MALANILVRLRRAELASPKLRADFANSFSLRCAFGKLNEQAIGELVAFFVAVNIRRDHFACACMVKRLDKIRGVAFSFESSKRTCRFVVSRFLQPLLRLAAISLFQKGRHKDTMNMIQRRAFFRRELRGLAAKFWQCLVLRRRFAICLGADDSAIEVESFRKQSSFAQPDSVSTSELAANGRDFHLKFPVVMPGVLDACAVNHLVFAEQASGFIPLTTDAVEQSVLVGFFRSAFAVLVPGANNTVPAAIAHGHSLTKLTVSIIGFLDDGGSHVSHIRRCSAPHRPPSFNTHRSEKPTDNYSPVEENRRGANPTRSHERHCEAPLRETRQAAPEWACASAALSSSKNSQFSRGTWPLRRKGYGFVFMSYSAANSIAEVIINKFPLWLQHSRTGRQTRLRAATDSRDENLRAKSPAAAVGSKEERKRERLSERPVVSLTRPTPPHNRKGSHRAVTATSRMARQANYNPVKISERRTPL
jgi:hypothetical protein